MRKAEAADSTDVAFSISGDEGEPTTGGVASPAETETWPGTKSRSRRKGKMCDAAGAAQKRRQIVGRASFAPVTPVREMR